MTRGSGDDGRLRVTMIGSLPPEKGVSAYIRDLAVDVARIPGVELDVVGFRSMYPRWLYPGVDPIDRNATDEGLDGVRATRALRWWNPLGWLLTGITLRGDIVHAQWWSAPLAPVYVSLLAVARLRRKRVVVTLHNVQPHEGGLLRRLANRAILPFAHDVIVHSEANARALADSGHTRSVHVVPIGVHTTTTPRADRRVAARAQLNIDERAPLALFFGNIRPYKGLDLLLEAFARVAQTLPAARLAVVGQPWAGPDGVRNAIERFGLGRRVDTRLDYVSADEMLTWIDAADVAVFPYTHFDAQSAAACDALGRGCAIIVSDVGGLAALVRQPCALVPPGDADVLAASLTSVLGDTEVRSRMEEDASALAAELAWPRVAARTVAVYREAIAADARTASTARVAGERP